MTKPSSQTNLVNDGQVDIENISWNPKILCPMNVASTAFLYPTAPVVSETLNEAFTIANQELQNENPDNKQLSLLQFQARIMQHSNVDDFLKDSTLRKELSKKYAILTGKGNDMKYEFHDESWWQKQLDEMGGDITKFPHLIYPITGETGDKNIASDGMFLKDVIYENPLLRCQYAFAQGKTYEQGDNFFQNILSEELSRRSRQIERVKLQKTYEAVLNATSPEEKKRRIEELKNQTDNYLETDSSHEEDVPDTLKKEMHDMMQVTDLNSARNMARRLARTREAITDKMRYSGDSSEDIKKLEKIQTKSIKRNIFSRALSSTSTGIVNVINYPGKKLNDSLNKSFKTSPRARDFFRALTSWMVFGGSGGNEVEGRGWGFSMFLVKAISAIAIPATLFGLSIVFPPLAFPLLVAAMSFSALALVSMFRNIFSNIKELVDRNNSTNVDLTAQIKTLEENLETTKVSNKISTSEENRESTMDAMEYFRSGVEVEGKNISEDTVHGLGKGEYMNINLDDKFVLQVWRTEDEQNCTRDDELKMINVIKENGISMVLRERRSYTVNDNPSFVTDFKKEFSWSAAEEITNLYHSNMIEKQEIKTPTYYQDLLDRRRAKTRAAPKETAV
jgi:hypothetical protein